MSMFSFYLYQYYKGTDSSALIQHLFCGIQDCTNKTLKSSTSRVGVGGGVLLSLLNGNYAILSLVIFYVKYLENDSMNLWGFDLILASAIILVNFFFFLWKNYEFENELFS
jgi:hypothetical protein